MAGQTIAEAIMERLAARGVRRMFGVPGGDCNLDMIEAGARKGVDFILTLLQRLLGRQRSRNVSNQLVVTLILVALARE